VFSIQLSKHSFSTNIPRRGISCWGIPHRGISCWGTLLLKRLTARLIGRFAWNEVEPKKIDVTRPHSFILSLSYTLSLERLSLYWHKVVMWWRSFSTYREMSAFRRSSEPLLSMQLWPVMHVGSPRFLVALYVGTDYYMHIEHPKITTHKKKLKLSLPTPLKHIWGVEV
jgi:hypothetical protein